MNDETQTPDPESSEKNRPDASSGRGPRLLPEALVPDALMPDKDAHTVDVDGILSDLPESLDRPPLSFWNRREIYPLVFILIVGLVYFFFG